MYSDHRWIQAGPDIRCGDCGAYEDQAEANCCRPIDNADQAMTDAIQRYQDSTKPEPETRSWYGSTDG